MNTLHDMRELLLKLYNESLEKYPLTTDEENTIYFENDDLTDEEFNRYNYICDCINMLDEDDKEDFIRLVLIYYYTINYEYTLDDNDTGYVPKDYEEDEEEIFDLIEHNDEETILETLRDNDYSDLFDLITFIIQEDIINLSELNIDKIDDFDEYKHLESITSKGNDISNIYFKLHPYMDLENKRYEKYHKYEDFLNKFINLKVNSSFEFAQMFSMAKQVIKSEVYVEDMLVSYLEKIKDNKDLVSNINIYMLKYLYIKEYLEDKKDKDNIKLHISKLIQEPSEIEHVTLQSFLDYDLNKHLTMMGLLSKEEKEELNNLISLDILKNYGNEGIWKRYSKEQYDSICKYSPLWLERINNYNEVYDIEIYYSMDSKGEYTIPRLCSFIKDNKFMSVLGRRHGYNIELDILDILENKIKEYKYENIITSDLSTLKYIKYLENKINNNCDLTNDEFEFVYGINNDDSYYVFGKYDSKIDEMRHNSDEKKLISNYYGCLESEVALTKLDLNSDTVVTKFFFPQKETCFYPKLRVILANAYCEYLESSKGLESLEYIKGDASFHKLTSSEGLSNLKYIGGNAYFDNLEDTSYLSKELVIKGDSFFKEGYEPTNLIKKK